MSAKPVSPSPLLGKNYLVALGVILIVALPFILYEQGGRLWSRHIQPMLMGPEAPAAMDVAVSESSSDGTATIISSLAIFLTELGEKKSDWLSRLPECLGCGETPCICQDLCPVCRRRNDRCICEICTDCGNRKGLCRCGPKSTTNAVPRRQIWDLPVHAVTYSRSGWEAWIGANRLAVGQEIVMSNNPAGPCGYRVLSISRNCVWAWVLRDETDAHSRSPEMVWPDFQSVRLMQDRSGNRPVGLVLADGRLLPLNRSLRFSRTQSSLALERLWPGGGEFALRMANGKELGRLVCVLPAR